MKYNIFRNNYYISLCYTMSKNFRRNRKGGRRASKKPKMSFAKRVLSVFNKERELKVGSPLNVNITNVRQDITAVTRTTNVVGLLSSIVQGTGENDRIGNSITLKKIVIRGYYKMNLPSGSAAASRILIRNAVMRQRNILDARTLTTGTVALNYDILLENDSAYVGSVGDYNTPWNKDNFVIRKEFKRSISTDFISGSSNAEGVAESYVFFNYTMTFGKGKQLHYRSDVAATPEDFPFFMLQSATAMSSAIILPTDAVSFNMVATPYYYDV